MTDTYSILGLAVAVVFVFGLIVWAISRVASPTVVMGKWRTDCLRAFDINEPAELEFTRDGLMVIRLDGNREIRGQYEWVTSEGLTVRVNLRGVTNNQSNISEKWTLKVRKIDKDSIRLFWRHGDMPYDTTCVRVKGAEENTIETGR